MEKKSIKHNDSEITFYIKRGRRRSFGLTVKPDLSVTLSAPEKSPLTEIEDVVRKKAKWIINKLNRFTELSTINPRREYINGELHLYLGEKYPLKTELASSGSEVSLENGILCVSLKRSTDPDAVKSQLYKWYRERAEEKFSEVSGRFLSLMKKKGIKKPEEIRVIRMRSRWGSCYPSRKLITLNTELIRMPEKCIEYVIVHELCHLKQGGHGKDFYALLARFIPDWKERRALLRTFLI